MPKQRRSNGGGWSAGPDYVSAGNLVNQQYSGVGKDCAGDVVRPGFISSYSGKGLPGLSGGSRRRRVKGGRYEMTPGPLIANSAIGMSGPASFSRIPCESSTTNSLNSGLYRATTAVGGSRRSRSRRSRGRRSHGGANFPVVHAGAADSMRYNAPNAGYTNTFEALPAGGAVPGFTVQTPYAPVVPNPACGMKGGSKRSNKSKRHGSKRRGSKRRGSKRRGSKCRRSRRTKYRVRFGGANNPSDNASPYSALSMDQVMNRSAFDGSNTGLPVKY